MSTDCEKCGAALQPTPLDRCAFCGAPRPSSSSTTNALDGVRQLAPGMYQMSKPLVFIRADLAEESRAATGGVFSETTDELMARAIARNDPPPVQEAGAHPAAPGDQRFLRTGMMIGVVSGGCALLFALLIILGAVAVVLVSTRR